MLPERDVNSGVQELLCPLGYAPATSAASCQTPNLPGLQLLRSLRYARAAQGRDMPSLHCHPETLYRHRTRLRRSPLLFRSDPHLHAAISKASSHARSLRNIFCHLLLSQLELVTYIVNLPWAETKSPITKPRQSASHPVPVHRELISARAAYT